MKQIRLLLLLSLFVTFVMHETYAKGYKFVVLETNFGTVKLRLYENTPKHSENFLKLVKEHHYDGMLFHRVIKDFMVQGGASDSKGAKPGQMLGMSDPGYQIDAEFHPEYFHKKGALAAAREGDEVNPDKKSSAEQFYIVQGKKYTDDDLNRLEKRRLDMAKNELGAKLFKPKQEEYKRYMQAGENVKGDSLLRAINADITAQFADYKAHLFSAEAREAYKTVGGTPFLDGAYTVFGEVVEGLDVIDKIAVVKTDQNDRPVEDVVILKAVLKNK